MKLGYINIENKIQIKKKINSIGDILRKKCE